MDLVVISNCLDASDSDHDKLLTDLNFWFWLQPNITSNNTRLTRIQLSECWLHGRSRTTIHETLLKRDDNGD